MSQCAEDQEVFRKFTTTLCRRPTFLEEPSRADLSDNAANVVADLRRQLDTTVFRLLVTAHSTEQFEELSRELYPEYVDVASAISTVVRVLDSHEDGIARAESAFSAIKECLEADDWLMPSQEGARDEAIFCLDSPHRAHFLAQDVAEYAARGVLEPEEYLKAYQAAIGEEWWSLLHLRCILFSIRHRIRPSDEVFGCLLVGFRHSLMAYVFAREALDAKCRSDYDGIDFTRVAQEASREYSSGFQQSDI